MNALFLWDSCSITLILFAVIPSVFSCSMLGLQSSSAAATLPRLEKGVPSPRRTHPAWVAAVALVVTGLVGIQEY